MRYSCIGALCALVATVTAQVTSLPSTGSLAWDDALAKAQALVSNMTIAELSNLTYGMTATNGCNGLSGSISRLDYPGQCQMDGPAGLRSDLATGFAAGVSVAASFNVALARDRGYFMGAEFKRKGGG